MTERAFLIKWILANGMGMALGFLAFVNVVFLVAFGLEFELYWLEGAQDDLDNAEHLLRWALVIGLPLAGAILTSFQAVVLRNFSIDLRSWILAGPIGFVVPLLVVWPLTAIWGDIPGPVEPFTIVGGGLVGTAVFQWWALRRNGMDSKRWLLLWIVGLPPGMIASGVTYFLIVSVGHSTTWAADVAIIGFAIGSCAAALSGREFLRTISGETSPVP